MMNVAVSAELDPSVPAAWTRMPAEKIFGFSQEEIEPAQLQALKLRFENLKDKIQALSNLVEGEGVAEINSLNDVLPLLFDHRVYKSYPLSLIEKRNFKRLTAWLNRLTTHDLLAIPLDGLTSVDDWLARLDDHGMIIGHSTGTTGKLSFIPRSRDEWPAWAASYFAGMTAALEIDLTVEKLHSISASYRQGHQMMVKMTRLMAEASASGEENRDVLYNHAISSDLLSLAGRLQAAEAKGELDSLEIDPEVLERHKEHIAAAGRRDDDLEIWFAALSEKYRGQRVMIGGTAADMVRIAMRGSEKGITCEFAADSRLMTGGGFKGYKGAPDDWQGLLMDFFGIPRISSVYGMSETMANCPKCSEGFYHIPPFMIAYVLDENAQPLPRSGVQTGRLALFDLLAETYWGGFISGDRVTIHWDDGCSCGMKGPRIANDIVRFSELQGGDDDKITCSGTQQAYNSFMDYVSEA